MSQSYNFQGNVLIDPGTYVLLQVQNQQSGNATSGVVTIIGESSQGPDFTQEPNLNANSFAPDQIQAVIAKYGSGRLVDAFNAIVAAANDPQIIGSVSAVKFVKTNPSTAASDAVLRSGFGEYADLVANSQGVPGNQLNYGVAISTPETAPQTGLFAYVPSYSLTNTTFQLALNGNAPASYSIAELTSGPIFASTIESVANGILAQGAVEQDILSGLTGTNIACAPLGASTTTLVITVSGTLAVVPAVGSTLVIPASGDYGAGSNSVIVGAGDANRGAYLITAVVPGTGVSTITATRINAPSGAPAVVAVSATPIAATTDALVYTNINIQNITGMNRNALPTSAGTYTWVVNGNQVTMTPPSAWVAQPLAGDYVTLASTLGTLAAGFYQVVSSTPTSMIMNRLSNGSAGTSGSTSATTPFVVLKPTIDGLGKTMQVVGTLAPLAYNGMTLTASTFGNTMLTSASEEEVATTIANSANNTSATYIAGGDVALSIGCSQAGATAVVGPTSLTLKVGSTVIATMLYSTFQTMNQIVSYINSQTTFSATLVTTRLGTQSPVQLDQGTYAITATLPQAQPGRIKQDAYEWSTTLDANAFVNAEMVAVAGLPEPVSPNQFLEGGTLAGTTSATFVAAIDACQGVVTNFIVPLISANASVDIAAGQTDPTSTYSIDAVNAYLNSHVIFMSDLPQRMNRVAIGSREGTFAQQMAAAQNLNSFRFGMTFQDVMVVNRQGTIQQYQSWMGAVIAAGMQAAAGYKGIVKKFANISGVVSPAGFNSALASNRIQAIQAGLLCLENPTTGGFRWVSDQMTYSQDNNFVYNSLQAVYIADLMALTLIAAFDQQVVGKSVAQVSAAGALSFLAGQMLNFLRLNWIAPSADAPKGYKNANVNLTGGVLLINVEVKLAGLIYFVPITFTVSQVSQTASAS